MVHHVVWDQAQKRDGEVRWRTVLGRKGLRVSRSKTEAIAYDFGEINWENDGAMHFMKMGNDVGNVWSK